MQEILDNGVRLVAEPTAGTGYVSICAAYDVGGVDDPPNQSGMAHLCEHVLFREPQSPRPWSEHTAQAATALEHTTFSLCGRTDQLTDLVDECARRLTHRRVSVAAAAHHKAVVCDEIRQKSGTAQFGSGLRRSLRLLFGTEHPLGRPPVGDDRQVRDIETGQVEAFIGCHHQPSRLVVAASGSFDLSDLARASEQRFAIGEPPCSQYSDPATEFAAFGERREDVDEGQSTGLVRATFALPSAGPDADAAELAFALFAKGPMSILAEGIGTDGALGISAEFIPHGKHPSLGMVRVNVIDERRLGDAVDMVRAAIQRLADGRVSEDMVTGARRRVLKERKAARSTATGRAAALARDALWGRDEPGKANAWPAGNHTDLVRDIARRYLGDPALVVFHPAATEEASWTY